MKKMMSKLVALMMAIVLLSGLCLSAGATEFSLTTSDDLMNMSIAQDCPQGGGYASTTEESGSGKSVGVFALRLRKGSHAAIMTAFLVKDGNESYILTHAMVEKFAAEGYELMLMGMTHKQTPDPAVLCHQFPEFPGLQIHIKEMGNKPHMIFGVALH